jgi:hypothetical protein
MRVSRPVRSALSGAAFAVGSLWAVAGLLHAIFGVAITFPLLPPLDLERISEVSAVAHALAFFAAGAVLGRWARAAAAAAAAAAPEAAPSPPPTSRVSRSGAPAA